MSRTFTPSEVSAFFFRLWQDTGGDADACAWALYELGKTGSEAGARRTAKPGSRPGGYQARYQAEAARSSELLRRRWRDLGEAVAAHHGTTVDALMQWKGRALTERRGTDVWCWLLHESAGLDFMKVGAITGRNHASAHRCWGRVQARIAQAPGLRAELLAMAEATAAVVRRAA